MRTIAQEKLHKARLHPNYSSLSGLCPKEKILYDRDQTDVQGAHSSKLPRSKECLLEGKSHESMDG